MKSSDELFYFVAGITLGVIAALLITPYSGEETRQYLRERVDEGRERAGDVIKLLMLVNDVSLRNVIPAELAKGFGFFHGKPWTAFSPVAVTPDELGRAWDGAKVNLPLLSSVNGAPFGRPNAGVDNTFDFPALIAHAAKTRPPSSGAPGSMLNRAKITFVEPSQASAAVARPEPVVSQTMPAAPIEMAPIVLLTAGPASATDSSARQVCGRPSSSAMPPKSHSVIRRTRMPRR